jgi:hypothetical protein
MLRAKIDQATNFTLRVRTVSATANVSKSRFKEHPVPTVQANQHLYQGGHKAAPLAGDPLASTASLYPGPASISNPCGRGALLARAHR